MPNPKRVFRVVVRCIPVVVALAFLAFYVTRARTKRHEMFSSSKNLRTLSNASDQWFLENPSRIPPAATPPLPTSSTPASVPPASSLSAKASSGAEAVSDPFLIGVLSERPVTLGGSKSAVPVVESSDFLRLWPLRPKATYHTFDLPPVRALPHEWTFSEPSIRVHVGSSVSQPDGASSPESLPASALESPASASPQTPTPTPEKPQAASEIAPVSAPASSPEP